jgi:hypothetical protein
MKLVASLLCVLGLVACGGGGGGSSPIPTPDPGSGVTPLYSLGGTINGLGGVGGLTLNNGTETIAVAANASTFTFATQLAQNTGYNVNVATQPVGLTCSVNNGAGAMGATHLNTVAVTCTAPPPSPVEGQAKLALFAGNLESWGNVDGKGTAARLNYPTGIATDSAGNFYVADTVNNTIRKITPDGVVSTFAGTAGVLGHADGTGAAARFMHPRGIATDSAGNVYVTEMEGLNHSIRKITPAGVVSTFAGATSLSGSVDGVGAAARFNSPGGIATDSAGNVYVADTGNHTIRKITPAGVVSTWAGAAGNVGNADGVGAVASFSFPGGITTDSAGNVHVADFGNRSIRKITPAGLVSTFAGKDEVGNAASFSYPSGITTDSMGNMYVVDSGYKEDYRISNVNFTIRKITPAGVVSTLAGAAGVYGTADGVGAAARFDRPKGIATDSAGNVYVTDSGNQTIRKITPAGVVSTPVGATSVSGSADGAGAQARFAFPGAIATDSAGNVYVADTNNNTIRKITPAGVVSTLAGAVGVEGYTDGNGAAARFARPTGIATDSAGNVYVADYGNYTIRKITPAGVVSTLAGGVGVYGSADGTGAGARFSNHGIATDSAGNVYVVDSGNATIRKITPAGVVSTLAGAAGVSGSADGTGAAARFSHPSQIATDSAGNVLVRDEFALRKITPAGVVSTLDLTVGVSGSTDGLGAAARKLYPSGIAIDSADNVYVADSLNHTISKITPAGVISTVVGVAGRQGFVPGALPGILSLPRDLAIHGTTLYITMANGFAVVTDLP